jgi:hypothetical protein
MSNIIQITKFFAPDGFSGRQQRDGAGLKYAVAASVSTGYKAEQAGSEAEASRQDHHYHNEDGYDEGLVHSHGWACGD